MSFIGDIIGDITGANQQAGAAQQASQTQAGASEAGIAENRRQFDKVIELMSPFVSSGTKALAAQQALIGLSGEDKQAEAIAAIEGSPQFAELVKQGENSLLQNASATGGLRGGNLQGALAKFRPSILSALIEQQFGRLGGLSQIGQAAAAGQASAGLSTGANIANLLEQRGAALAGGQIAGGSANRMAFGDALKIGGVVGGFF